MAEATSPAADVRVEFLEPGQVAAGDLDWMATAPSIWRAQVGDARWLRLRYELEDTWAEFVIDGHGDAVFISRSPDVLASEVTEVLLGQVFSCLAGQRGSTCVHASVVKLEDRVIAVVGPSGAGKSTTALALVQSGGGILISDDIAILSDRDLRPMVAIGAPRIRMREAPAISLVGQTESLDRVWPDGRPAEPKWYVAAPREAESFDEDALPLDVIYFLEPPSDKVMQPLVRGLAPTAALPKLMAHRHMAQALERGADKRDFERLARLLRVAPARELARPYGLETTEQTVATIVSDVRGLV